MSDLMLINYYNEIKDDSWPEISNYTDFFKLPEEIKEACMRDHSFDERIAEIENPEHWQKILAYGYQFENLVYVPTKKCGSTYYSELFMGMGWKHTFLADVGPDAVCFGLMMDPFKRHLKGLTEFVHFVMTKLKKYDETLYENTLDGNVVLGLILLNSVMPDSHTIPHSFYLEPYLDSINWIPMDLYNDNEIKNLLMELFKANGHNITLPINDQRLNESDSFKLKIYEQVKTYYHQNPLIMFIYIFLSKDLKFYRNLLETFDPTWQKFKTI